MIRWAQSGYDVVFTTRKGGVSVGPYASLNLGRLTHDLGVNVEENRRRVCAELGVEPSRLAMNRQVHSATVREAAPGARGAEADGLWTSEPGLPVMALSADCLPIALARTAGERRLVVLHAGWRGLLAGIVESGVSALGGGPVAAVIGPSIGPCCYEVGAEVSERFDLDLTTGRKLDLWTAAERRLRAAGVQAITRLDLCTSCNRELYFSHRRDAGVTGRQGVVGVVT